MNDATPANHQHCWHPTGSITQMDVGHYVHLRCCFCRAESGQLHGFHWQPSPDDYPDYQTSAERTRPGRAWSPYAIAAGVEGLEDVEFA